MLYTEHMTHSHSLIVQSDLVEGFNGHIILHPYHTTTSSILSYQYHWGTSMYCPVIYLPLGHQYVLPCHILTTGALVCTALSYSYHWGTSMYCPVISLPMGHQYVLPCHIITTGALVCTALSYTYHWGTSMYCPVIYLPLGHQYVLPCHILTTGALVCTALSYTYLLTTRSQVQRHHILTIMPNVVYYYI